MEVNRLLAFLVRHRLLALDTSIFIYQLEANPRYLPLTDHIFRWLERSGGRAVTSTLTMSELLVQPYRDANQKRADEFYSLLSIYPNLEWVAPNLEIADLAARIRSLHRLRTPDALQAATALYCSATAMITNDPVFKRVAGIETMFLEELN